MQRLTDHSHDDGTGPLTSDALRLVRIVARWASSRSILRDAVLFGDRLQSGRRGSSSVEVYVTFDRQHLEDGFDDWIEQLRTRFVTLSDVLDEPVSVLTPDCRDYASVMKNHIELPAFNVGKARLAVPRPASETTEIRASVATSHSGSWTARLLSAWALPVAGPMSVTSRTRS